MYHILPETENCTLEDIELHFSDNRKGLFDRKITRNSSATSHANNIETSNKSGKESTSNGCTNNAYVADKY